MSGDRLSPRRFVPGGADGLATAAGARVGVRALSSVMFGLTIIGMARIAPPAEFGAFMVSGATAMVAGIVLTLGAGPRALQADAEATGRVLARSLYQVQAIVCVAASVLVAVMAVAGVRPEIVAGAAWGLGDVAQTYAQNHASGLKQHRAANWLIAVQRVPPGAMVLGYLIADEPADFRALGAMFVVVLVIAIVAPWPSVRGVDFDARPALRGAWGWWSLSLSMILNLLQAPVLALATGAATAGIFALASRVIGPILMVPTAVATVVVPELAALRGRPDLLWLRYRGFSRFCLGYGALVLLLVWPAALVVTTLAGVDERGAVVLVAGTVAAASLSAYSQSLAGLIAAVGRPARVMVALTAGGAVGLVLLAVLGRWGSLASLGAVQLGAEVVVLGTLAYGVRQLRRVLTVSPG